MESNRKNRTEKKSRKIESEDMCNDPVCRMDVDKSGTEFISEYNGQNYYFCSAECKDDFDSDPDRYAVDKHAF